MHPVLQKLINMRVAIPSEEGISKLAPLDEALRQLVKPEMTLHFATTHSRPYAAIHELLRQHWGDKPAFTFSSLRFTSTMVALALGGLGKHYIGTFFGDRLPGPEPNPIWGEALLSDEVTVEHWSTVTLIQRLQAGAMGVPCAPTRCLIGSTMATDNQGMFVLAKDPFSEGQVGFVQALRPDLTFVHAVAADRHGNLLLTPPWGEGVVGALAARQGVIATVERIVSTNYIRRHSHLGCIPAYAVRAVCPVRMGAHPTGLTPIGLEDAVAYAEDYAFQEEVHHVSHDRESAGAFVKKWILDCPDQDAYLNQLGLGRQLALNGKADASSWIPEIHHVSEAIALTTEPTAVEWMITAAATKLSHNTRRRGYATILADAGIPTLVAWLASMNVKDQKVDVDLMTDLGLFGYAPRPVDPYAANARNLPTSKIVTDMFSVLGFMTSGPTSSCVGVITAFEIDPRGNVNLTRSGDREFFVGSGSANDIASLATEVMVVCYAGMDSLVPKVSYVTCPGNRVRTLVTDVGVFEKLGSREDLVLTGYYKRTPDLKEEEALDEIQGSCAWELVVADKLVQLPPPPVEQLLYLRMFDPLGACSRVVMEDSNEEK